MSLHCLELTLEEFNVVQKFLADSCGIILNDGKEYLVKSRLANVIRDTEHSSINELIKALRGGSLSLAAQTKVMEAMTTNETFWFRDANQFEELKRTILPELAKSRASTLRIWSAASSSGQEPYSISMCVEEFHRSQVGGLKKAVQIVGTDISSNVLQAAKSAVYNDLALARGLPADYRSRYFQKCHDGWKLIDSVTSRVRFQQFNLLKPYSAMGKFDVIFCRNVLIYFSEDIKRDMISRMAQCLTPGGYFFLSSTEAMPRGIDSLEPAGTAQTRYFRLKT